MDANDAAAAHSPDESWGVTQIKSENFQYKWEITNFRPAYEMMTELRSPIFSFGVDELQWQIIISRPEPGMHNPLSFNLKLLTCSEEKIPTEFKFEIFDPANQRAADKVTDTQIFSKESPTHGIPYCGQTLVAGYRKGEILVLLSISYLKDPIHESGQKSIPFENPKDRLSADFGCLLNNQNFSDVTFSISGEQFKAHKAIVSARSPVFDAMFKNEMSESKNNLVVINDIDKEVFREFLKYIYTDKTEKLQQMASDLLGVADKYEVNGLKMMCINVLHKGLTTDNAPEVLALAELYSLTELKTRAIKFINNHSADIADTIGFKNLTISSPTLIADIFRARKTDC